MEKIVTRNFNQPDSYRIDTYMRNKGYEAARKALTEMQPAAIIDEVKKANLRGLGGA